MNRRILIGAALLVWGNVKSQQDVHYSQFYANPLAVNPACAGMFEGSFRMVLDYRNQWNSVTTPWTTMSASADMKFGEDELSGNFFNGGVIFHTDKAGDSQFKTGLYNLSFGYTIHVSRGAYFSTALQGGLIQNSIDYTNLNWETQYNGYAFDPTKPSMETQSGVISRSRGDLSLGIYYFNAVNDKVSIFAGASGMHLLAHNVAFSTIKDRIYRRVNVHGGTQIIVDRFGILPNFMYMLQGPNQVINVGSDFKVWLKEQSLYTGFIDEVSAGLGLYYRVGDAVMASAKFNYAGFNLSASYDFNLSDFQVATNKVGGFEVLLGYRANFGIGKGKETKFL